MNQGVILHRQKWASGRLSIFVWILLVGLNLLPAYAMPPPISPSAPTGIASGPDRSLWFSQAGGYIGRIDPTGVISTEYKIPARHPSSITSDREGNLWVTQAGGEIDKITPAGVVIEYETPTTGSTPLHIISGPDGNLWFVELWSNKIGRLSPDGVITEFPIPTPNSDPYSIVSGPDGNFWFVGLRYNKIGKITPAGVITEFSVQAPKSATEEANGSQSLAKESSPIDITSGPDGNLWFTEYRGNQIGKISPQGVITEFPLPTARSYPNSITRGADGNLWFTESGGMNWNLIGRITPTGAITEFAIPTANSDPSHIISGADGNLWFGEYGIDAKIGKVSPAGVITEYSIPPLRRLNRAISQLINAHAERLNDLEPIFGKFVRKGPYMADAFSPRFAGDLPLGVSNYRIRTSIDIYHQDPSMQKDAPLDSYCFGFDGGLSATEQELAKLAPAIELEEDNRRVVRYENLYLKESDKPDGPFELCWYRETPEFALPKRADGEYEQIVSAVMSMLNDKLSRTAIEEKFGAASYDARHDFGLTVRRPTWQVSFVLNSAARPPQTQVRFSFNANRPLDGAQLLHLLNVEKPRATSFDVHMTGRSLVDGATMSRPKFGKYLVEIEVKDEGLAEDREMSARMNRPVWNSAQFRILAISLCCE